MKTPVLALMAQRREALRRYATRVFLHSETLNEVDENNKSYQLHEFFSIGTSLNLSKRELVLQIYQPTIEVPDATEQELS